MAAAGPGVRAEPGDEVVDLTGYVLLPGLAEPHAHLEKAFTAGRTAAGSGDLAAAIAAWIGLRGQLTEADFAARARRAALSYLASGATAIRTHTDVGAEIGLTAFRALAAVREELAGTVDIEIVATAQLPGHRAGRPRQPRRRAGRRRRGRRRHWRRPMARPGPRGGLPDTARPRRRGRAAR